MGLGFPHYFARMARALAYLLLVFGGIPLVQASVGSVIYVIYVLGLTTLLIGICWLKGEPPRWRWGDRDA
jgi:hypothetical protein